MSDVVIQVENLGKQYFIGGQQKGYRTIRESIGDAVMAPFRRLRAGRGDAATESFWALKDVSFEVKRGEVLGVIGRNGAGKSTLLKVLSRITEPTQGIVRVKGRVGSLLEVGTGFHPELTGRENIYLNGTILGMRRNEITRKFDEIVAFAEVDQFIDTPVKRYSSGMYMRLAFSVAAHLEPEILLVDEVLAVGDAQFQKKCLGKMNDVASEGRTLLFVSHNMAAMQNLCKGVLWLDKGSVVESGETDTVIVNYLNNAIETSMDQQFDDIDQAPGNDRIRVHRVCVRATEGNLDEPITMTTSISLEFEYWNLKHNTFLNLSLEIYSMEGTLIFSTAPVHNVEWLKNPYPKALFRSICNIPGYLLNSGSYRVNVLFVEDQARIIYRMDDALVFDIAESPEVRGASTWFDKWPGIIHPKTEWKTSTLSLFSAEIH